MQPPKPSLHATVVQQDSDPSMSRLPGNDEPRTPERKPSASSGLLQAFRNLTSNRPKSFSHSTPTPPTVTPVQSDVRSLTNGQSNHASISGNDSPTTVSRDTSDDCMVGTEDPLASALGGPIELPELISQLHETRSSSDRLRAGSKLCYILEEFKINSPLSIWNVGKDLIHQKSDESARLGHLLLLCCAKTHPLTAHERHVLFHELDSLSDDRHLELRLFTLNALTSSGRNVESVECDLLPYIARILGLSFKATKEDRYSNRTNGSSHEAALDGMFEYIINVTKFNAKVFDELDYALVVQAVRTVCSATTSHKDIRNAVKVLMALLTYAQVPAQSINDCLELLADIYRQIRELKLDTWQALASIFKTHLGQAAIDVYLNLVHDGPLPGKRMVSRGAFRVLYRLFEDDEYGLPKVSLSHLLGSLHAGLASRDVFLAEDALQFLKGLLFNDDERILLENEPDWAHFILVIAESAEILDLNIFVGSSESSEHASESEDETNTSVKDDLSVARSSSSSKKAKRAKETVNKAKAYCNLQDILLKTISLLPSIDLIHRDSVVRLLLRLGRRLSNSAAEILVTCCREDRLILSSNYKWLQTSKSIIVDFLYDLERPMELRLQVLKTFMDSRSLTAIASAESTSELALLIAAAMPLETNAVVLDELAGFAVVVADDADDGLFQALLDKFHATIFQKRKSLAVTANMSPLGGFPLGSPHRTQQSLCCVAVQHVIRLFTLNYNKSATKAELLFDLILEICDHPACPLDARICAMKLLFRLRADGDYAISIPPESESERIAAILCRTPDTAIWMPPGRDSALLRTVSSGNVYDAVVKPKAFDVKRPVPPLWVYPARTASDEDSLVESSLYVRSYQDPDVSAQDNVVVLRLALWLEKIIGLLQQADSDWEIYSYVIVHLGAQIANQNLFCSCIPQIKFLRNVVCDQMRASSFHEPPSHTSLKKTEVAICLFHTLTMVTPYHDHFARSEEDDIVRTFLQGIGHWDGRTSKWCIHALSVCCFEMPLSVSKLLDNIVDKMSQIVTQSQVAIHILEFLVMVARCPDLYKNFGEYEYRRIFGVSNRYLQYVRERKEQQGRGKAKETISTSTRPTKAPMRHSDSFRELSTLYDLDPRTNSKSNADDLPQYVYALAFHVITFWFMNLKLHDRPSYVQFISSFLTYRSNDGKAVIEDAGLVTMDMMERIGWSDRDETAYDPNFAKVTDGEVHKQTWIVGYSLLTIETAARTGLSQITRRRPSGTKYSIFMPALTQPPRHQVPITVGLEADAFFTSSYVGVLPQDIIQEFYSSYNLLDVKAPRPIELPDDDAVHRAISAFDRNSTVDGHKVGVIYIGERQDMEADILKNTKGSYDYDGFISRLGTLVELKDAQFNTQGLDRFDNSDGTHAYCWRDRATEIVFHVTTMMPTKLDSDPLCTQKKSHIGNDFVNIVWNNSGKPFKFDTFPSAFNYVYIVITPDCDHGFVSLREKTPLRNLNYKVQIMSRPDFPEISPAADVKLLSEKALPDFVRLLALNASYFSLVWQARELGEHVSPWRNRLREIQRLRDRYGTVESKSQVSSTHNKALPASVLEKAYSETNVGNAVANASQARERGGTALGQRLAASYMASFDNASRVSSNEDTSHE